MDAPACLCRQCPIARTAPRSGTPDDPACPCPAPPGPALRRPAHGLVHPVPAVSYRSGRFWQPDVTVATVVVRDGRLLVVEETVGGARVLNQPAGHLEPDESLHAAALRETLEETGWDVELTAFIGAYQWKSPVDGRHFLRMAFAAEPLLHHADRALDEGIIQALWLTPGELQAESARHRSPLVWRAVEDFLAGRRFPLQALTHFA